MRVVNHSATAVNYRVLHMARGKASCHVKFRQRFGVSLYHLQSNTEKLSQPFIAPRGPVSMSAAEHLLKWRYHPQIQI